MPLQTESRPWAPPGAVERLGLSTSAVQKPTTTDAKEPKVADRKKLSGPSPTRKVPASTSRGVAPAARKRNLLFPSKASLAGKECMLVRELGEPQTELALRDLYSCLDREWIGAGVQLTRQSAGGVGGLHQE